MNSSRLFAALAMGLAPPACVAEPAPDPVRHGTFQMPLVATGSSGTLYHLSGTFDVLGPTSTSFSADGLQTEIQVALQVGNYDIFLHGWQLQRDAGGMFVPVQATLLSTNPQSFAIQENAVTQVAFSFQTQGDGVSFGNGTLVVTFNVEDQLHEAACGDGVDNDTDGLVDCMDPDCSGNAACAFENCSDGVDNNGDGLVDCADPVCQGSLECQAPRLLFNEIMRRGTFPDPSQSEWFEIRNVDSRNVTLDGCMIRSANDAPLFLMGGPVIAPGEVALFARLADPNLFGGMAPDYVYSGLFLEDFGFDFLELTCGGAIIDHVAFNNADFPFSEMGRSIQLDPSIADQFGNDMGFNWCPSLSPYMTPSGTAFGTPRQQNDFCF